MNGFKRASRRQAAVVGLAVLMGVSFLGCHTGPKLFSKKDRNHRADKQALAEQDKGKFINRKKVRPESDFRRDDADDERVAKSDGKTKPKTKPSDSLRKPTGDEDDRAVTNRKSFDDLKAESPRTAKATAAQQKTAKPSEPADMVRRESSKRPTTDLLNDSLLDEKLSETRNGAKAIANSKSTTKSALASQANSADADPFQNSVVGSSMAKRPTNKVATVNFDDEDLDDERQEEAEEQEEFRASATRNNNAAADSTAKSVKRRTTSTMSQSQQKFLDDLEDEPRESLTLREQAPAASKAEPAARSAISTTKRPAEPAQTVAGQEVIDRRQNVKQTLDNWRREMDRDESISEFEEKPVAPMPRTTARPNSSTLAKGHISQTSIEEFTPPAQSQGAVLDGELIIDTNALPSRFQRSSANPSGRMNSNSGVNIDIVPGATQNRMRPNGQISLQSLSEQEDSSELTTADYAESRASDDLGSLPPLKLTADSETGFQLAAKEDESGIAPAPPALAEMVAGMAAEELPSGSRGWKQTLLVLSAITSALIIGFRLKRRMEPEAAAIRFRNFSSSSDAGPNDSTL